MTIYQEAGNAPLRTGFLLEKREISPHLFTDYD